MKYKLKRRFFTRYDDTDRLKQMRDSDILAERKKEMPGYGDLISSTTGGVLAGAAGGGLIGGASGLLSKNGKLIRGAARGGKIGAVVGGTTALILATKKRNKNRKDRTFYNDRLEYAQRQARRREKKDWKENMTQREGYTY